MTGIPAMTTAEIRLAARDKHEGRHWPGTDCWCDRKHDGSEAGITLVAPPWSEQRHEGAVR
jgi:hypothetical protein